MYNQLACRFASITIQQPSYGTAKSGVGVSAMSVLRPDLMMKCTVPVVMAGIIGVGPSFRSAEDLP